MAPIDRCQLRINYNVLIIEAPTEDREHTTDEFSISKSTIQRIPPHKNKKNNNFQNQVPDSVTFHCDGKLLLA